MRRLIAVFAVGAAVSTLAIGVAAGAPVGKPYVGSWKSKVTADLLLDNGIAQPQFRGMWRLELNRDGTYRAYNPWDKWLEGSYSANATRMVFSKDKGCIAGGFRSPGLYRWKITKGKLDLTGVAVGSDTCGGRWQTLAIPLWTRA
jgi:hypothetical protein